MLDDEHLQCSQTECSYIFPIVDGIPILLNESSSIYSIEEFLKTMESEDISSYGLSVLNLLKRLLPKANRNLTSKANFLKFSDQLLGSITNPRVLVIGGRIIGKEFDSILSDARIDFIETDVSYGPRTQLICDSHDLPFIDGVFDGVVIQAVLEHVADPYRCVEDIHRVLTGIGLVYAETPFIQQVHEGSYDFTRFTHIGHRRLFRRFSEIESGVVGGPGMALAWSYRYFLLSFTKSRTMRRIITAFSHITSFWLRYFDKHLGKKPGAYDAASGYYFLGKRESNSLSDKEIVQMYRGCL